MFQVIVDIAGLISTIFVSVFSLLPLFYILVVLLYSFFLSFYCHFLKLRDSFLSHVQSANELISGILPLCYIFFMHFFQTLRISISLFTLLICSCKLSTLPINSLSLVIIAFKIHGLIIPTFLPYLTVPLILVKFLQSLLFIFQYVF